MIAELDAVNLYEQLAAMAEREEVKKLLLGIAKEENLRLARDVGEKMWMLYELLWVRLCHIQTR